MPLKYPVLAYFLYILGESMQITKCFEILGVDNDAPWHVIKKSYHILAKKLHPDTNPSSSDAENKFKEVNIAFQVLRSHFGNPSAMNLVHVDSLKNPFEFFFHRIWQSPKFEKWRKNCTDYLIHLDTRIFHLNIHKNIQVSGATANKGRSIHIKAGREKFEVKIPKGDWNQMSFCIPGKGEASLFSKRRGSLILDVKVQRYMPQVSIEESSFYYEMAIDKTKIGKVLTLNSSEGPIKFVLPRNTVSGQTLCLRGRSEKKHILKVVLN